MLDEASEHFPSLGRIVSCFLAKTSVGEWFANQFQRDPVEFGVCVTDLRRHRDRGVCAIFGTTALADLDENPGAYEALEDGPGYDTVDVEQFSDLTVGGARVASDLDEDQGRSGIEKKEPSEANAGAVVDWSVDLPGPVCADTPCLNSR